VQGRGLVDLPVLLDQEVGPGGAVAVAVERGLGRRSAGLVDDDAVHHWHVTSLQRGEPAHFDKRAANHPVFVDTEHASSLMRKAAIQRHERSLP